MQATLHASTITIQLPEASEPVPEPRRRRWAEALGWAARPDPVPAQFLHDLAASTRRDEVHNLLLEAARRLTGALRVEVRPVGGPNRVLVSRSLFGQPTAPPIELPIRYRDDVLGMLLLTPRPGRRISATTLAELESLCAMAAIGDRLLGRERHLRVSMASPLASSARPNALLLPHVRQLALLARRRREPLGLLAVGVIDPGAGPEGDLGPMSEAVSGILRESDLVVQFDERTLIAVLPNASAASTSVIAESVARSILETLGWSELPRLALGAACYPDDAREADVLLDVALEALRSAREDGRGPIVVADREAFAPRMREDDRVGAAG